MSDSKPSKQLLNRETILFWMLTICCSSDYEWGKNEGERKKISLIGVSYNILFLTAFFLFLAKRNRDIKQEWLWHAKHSQDCLIKFDNENNFTLVVPHYFFVPFFFEKKFNRKTKELKLCK